jgi:hypothetical protein
MIRLLLLLAVVGLAAAAVRRLGSTNVRKRGRPAKRLVKCARCGLYITEDTAVMDGDRPFCCEQHRREIAGDSDA